MKQDLETVRLELEDYLAKHTDFAIFHGFSRAMEEVPLGTVQWNTRDYPDYRLFLEAAKKVGAKLIGYHAERLEDQDIEETIEDLEAADLPYEERRDIERRLKELRLYSGFTGALELSFDYEGTLYLFSLQTDWFTEAVDLMDLYPSGKAEGLGGDDESYGGYFSKN